MKKNLVIEIISTAFIFLFVYAAASKLMDVDKFAAQIGQSPLLTDINYLVAWSIPAAEVMISALLCFQKTRLTGLYLSLNLMILFTVYIIAILSFGEHIPCSCGGVLERLGWTEHLIFNTSFVVLAALGIWMEKKQQNEQHAQYIHKIP